MFPASTQSPRRICEIAVWAGSRPFFSQAHQLSAWSVSFCSNMPKIFTSRSPCENSRCWLSKYKSLEYLLKSWGLSRPSSCRVDVYQRILSLKLIFNQSLSSGRRGQEFSRMFRLPIIAHNWIEDHRDKVCGISESKLWAAIGRGTTQYPGHAIWTWMREDFQGCAANWSSKLKARAPQMSSFGPYTTVNASLAYLFTQSARKSWGSPPCGSIITHLNLTRSPILKRFIHSTSSLEPSRLSISPILLTAVACANPIRLLAFELIGFGDRICRLLGISCRVDSPKYRNTHRPRPIIVVAKS